LRRFHGAKDRRRHNGAAIVAAAGKQHQQPAIHIRNARIDGAYRSKHIHVVPPVAPDYADLATHLGMRRRNVRCALEGGIARDGAGHVQRRQQMFRDIATPAHAAQPRDELSRHQVHRVVVAEMRPKAVAGSLIAQPLDDAPRRIIGHVPHAGRVAVTRPV